MTSDDLKLKRYLHRLYYQIAETSNFRNENSYTNKIFRDCTDSEMTKIFLYIKKSFAEKKVFDEESIQVKIIEPILKPMNLDFNGTPLETHFHMLLLAIAES